MRNIIRLFVSDMRRVFSNVVTTIIVLGLVLIPSIFSWYNVLACWNVFDNTGNLSVAVANSDEGFKSDLVPIEINIGEKVTGALRANDQLNWVFTNEQDAIEGTKDARYYAAVVIPKSFSRDMMSFYSDDVEHAHITYYTNQKTSAIAPKVTDQGADAVSREVNKTFTETLSEIALGLASGLADNIDDAEVDGAIGKLADHAAKAGADMNEAADALSLYADLLASSVDLIEDSHELLAQSRQSAADVTDELANMRKGADSLKAALDESSSALVAAIKASSDAYASVPATIEDAFDASGAVGEDVSGQLRANASRVDALIGDYEALVDKLESAQANAAKLGDKALAGLVKRLNESITLQKQLRDALFEAADKIDTAGARADEDRAKIEALAGKAQESIDAAKVKYKDDLAPELEKLGTQVADAGDAVSATAVKIADAADGLDAAAGELAGKLVDAQGKIEAAASDLRHAATKIGGLSDDIAGVLAKGDTEALREIIGSNPDTLAQVIAAPVALERHAVFPVETFGSAMSPLYTTLALWIGALVMLVTLRVVPSERSKQELDNPTPQQLFLGRFGVISVISLMQSTTVSLGNMLFLGVQVSEPLLYLICFWVSGLVFAFIIYTMVALFGNLGKALGVILLIVQVAGGGGSFPMQLLPEFFQNMNPYLPIAHAVNAMRAAMFGVYANDFWVQIGMLVLLAVPFGVLGLALNKPLGKVVPKFVERVESSKLM